MSTARRGGRPIIKPPKKHGQEFSAEKTWLALSKSIKEIQNHNAASLSFEENYRYAYNMVLHKQEDMLYRGVSNLVAENLDILAKDHIVPRFPAGSINDPVQKAQSGELLLKGLREVWDDHVSIMVKLGQLLKYLDRMYPEKGNVPSTWGKGLELFLKHIIKSPIKDNLVTAVLEQVQCEREGYVINRSAVKGCVDVFLWLEADNGTVYKQELESVLLKESDRFYQEEASHLLNTCDCHEYLRRVESRFESEDSRIHHYLSPQTSPALSKILESALLIPNLTTVISMPGSGLDTMIDTNKVDDLARLYRLYSPVAGGLPCLKKALRDSILRRGKDLNEASSGPASGEGEGDDEKEDDLDKRKDRGKGKARAPVAALAAIKWVQDVLDLKDKFDSVWKSSFKSDREIEATLNEAFEGFINNHPKAPEYTSLFIDDHLKRGLKGKTENEVDIILDKTITVFRFISDKDVFERYYKNHLAKRLLLARSVSDDAERGMLSKLKVESGYQFTSKLEGMFNDIKLSADAMDSYRTYLQNRTSPAIEISVTVMTSTFWPYSAPTTAPIVPPILAEASKSFEAFYFSRHSGRRLTWLTSMGNADVRVAFNNRHHDLNVSTHALIILLLFESLGDDDFLTYSELKEGTKIEESDLKRNLQSLACAKFKILKKHPPGRDISDDDSFSFNSDFSAPLQKIKISTVASKPETNQERRETQDRVDEERKHQIEACTVRIMKDRKTMTHVDLVHEVTRQLSSRFCPDPISIKRRIEALIEREYLERREDRSSYNYVA